MNCTSAPYGHLQLAAGVEAEGPTFHLSPYCNARLENFSAFLSPLCSHQAPIIANLLRWGFFVWLVGWFCFILFVCF